MRLVIDTKKRWSPLKRRIENVVLGLRQREDELSRDEYQRRRVAPDLKQELIQRHLPVGHFL
jgi:hypothetical protein